MNSALPLIPDTAPFTPEQRAWLNGFLAGVFSRARPAPTAASTALAAPALTPLTILFGSQSGTAERLARQAAKVSTRRGFAATVANLGAFDLPKLAPVKNLLVIVSTFGDGEPPDGAKPMHAALAAATGTPLAGVRFSVCALGDTNYAKFCQCGKDFDAFLEKLGATRVAPRADCDLDQEEPFTAWLDAVLPTLAPAAAPVTAVEVVAKTTVEPAYSRKNPFPAAVLAVRRLNGAGSAKEVNHLEFSLADSGLTYEVGDALGVCCRNCPALVAELLAALGADGTEAVPLPAGDSAPLRQALTEAYDLGRPSQQMADLLRPDGAGEAEAAAPTPPHVIDLLRAAPTRPPLPAFVAALKKLQPRLYSISSSPRAHPGQVHLTVAAVRYAAHGRPRHGACSTFLADRARAAGRVGVFVHRNPNFRPPRDPAAPMIMVGPGTGIAPFRAFLAERRATGAPGANWLFFGDQHAATDFLYRAELEELQTAGVLTRLEVAWSRDQAEKVYVQQRMLAQAAELHAWLERGAHFYVCGDASRMARDVHAALLQVVGRAGGRSPAQAADYVQRLQNEGRYQRDVY